MSTTAQPVWKLVANLGDVTYLDYGGYFVYTDSTGVYPPEAELLEPLENGKYMAYRFILEPCTFINGVLSDNKFHPTHPVWFADSLQSIAEYIGSSVDELVTLLCSANPCERAGAWRTVGDYHGFDNLDSYPLELTRKEATKRYKEKAVKP